MPKVTQQNAEKRMQKSIQSFEETLQKFRAGRAHPSLLDAVMVLYYGNQTPLSQVASVVVEGPMMLVIRPWEKNLIPAIEKGILLADLGLNPSNAGDCIRVPLPPLSEERRKELIKRVRAEAEDAKIAIRAVRRDANQECKDRLKAKDFTEDQLRQTEEGIQKLTDQYTLKVDKLLEQKEADLLSF